MTPALQFQFGLHYSWSTEARARQALANVSALLCPGGILSGRCLMRMSLSKSFENVCLKVTIWILCWLTLSPPCSCCNLCDSIKLFYYAQRKVWNLGTVFTGLALVKSMLKR